MAEIYKTSFIFQEINVNEVHMLKTPLTAESTEPIFMMSDAKFSNMFWVFIDLCLTSTVLFSIFFRQQKKISSK